MNECRLPPDRMAEVAHGRGRWTAEESRHLESCLECQAAWRLVQAGSTIGRNLPPPRPERISARVLARLQTADEASEVVAIATRRRWIGRSLAVAAAAVLLFMGGRAISSLPGATGREQIAAELDDLSEGELEFVLDGYPPAVDIVLPDGAVGLSDLEEGELEQVLRSLEG